MVNFAKYLIEKLNNFIQTLKHEKNERTFSWLSLSILIPNSDERLIFAPETQAQAPWVFLSSGIHPAGQPVEGQGKDGW